MADIAYNKDKAAPTLTGAALLLSELKYNVNLVLNVGKYLRYNDKIPMFAKNKAKEQLTQNN